MNHPWQQPIRPLEVNPNGQPGHWYSVIFIRALDVVPKSLNGVKTEGYTTWQVISAGGHTYDHGDSMLRTAP
jgi:hypothetical protein